MSPASVFRAMLEPQRCPHTKLTIPECSCASCCRRLIRRYAPHLLVGRNRKTPRPGP